MLSDDQTGMASVICDVIQSYGQFLVEIMVKSGHQAFC